MPCGSNGVISSALLRFESPIVCDYLHASTKCLISNKSKLKQQVIFLMAGYLCDYLIFSKDFLITTDTLNIGIASVDK